MEGKAAKNSPPLPLSPSPPPSSRRANGAGRVEFPRLMVSTFGGFPVGCGASQHRWSIELTAVDREGWGRGFLRELRSHPYAEIDSQIRGNPCDILRVAIANTRVASHESVTFTLCLG